MKRLAACITILRVVLSAASLAGCDSGETPPDETPVELDGTQWTLRLINDSELVEGSHISLYFRDGSFWGCYGCNTYGGDYSTEAPDILIVSGCIMTEMACSSPAGVMEQESAYIDSLCKAAFYHATGEQLEIGDSANQGLLVFERKPEYPMEPADLVGTSWRLISMDGDDVTEGLYIELTFDSDSIATGRAGCFDYELHYQASSDDIRWGMTTRRSGELPRGLENEALRYTDSLMWGANYRLSGERLEIFTSRGETLVYEPLSN
jgi:heat shock protein HslJ